MEFVKFLQKLNLTSFSLGARTSKVRSNSAPIEFGNKPNILRGYLPLSSFVLDAGGSSERLIFAVVLDCLR